MEKLDKLIKSGDIRIDRGEYVGKAKDGVEVLIGEVGDEARIETYLQEYPPDKW